jgi:LPXTG-motif cell wall-anchored protein
MSENSSPQDEEGINVSSRLFAVLILGFLLVFIGIIVLVIAALISGGSASVGGVIFIGPIPIVFGAGPDANWLILISIILAVVSFALLFVYRRRKSMG